MAEPARQLRDCPRVIGADVTGKRLKTCGHLEPCPFHGADPDLHLVRGDSLRVTRPAGEG